MRGAARDRRHDAGVIGEAGYRSAAGDGRWSGVPSFCCRRARALVIAGRRAPTPPGTWSRSEPELDSGHALSRPAVGGEAGPGRTAPRRWRIGGEDSSGIRDG